MHNFLIFALKHRLWVLVRTMEAVLTCTHNLCFEQKYENNKRNSTEIFHFYSHEKLLYFAGGCFCNVKNEHKFQKDIACSCHYNHNRLLLKSKNDKFHTRGIDCGKLVSGSLKRSELRRTFILCSSSCRSMYSMSDYRSPF